MRETYITTKRQHRRVVRSTVAEVGLVQSPAPQLARRDPGKGTNLAVLHFPRC